MKTLKWLWFQLCYLHIYEKLPKVAWRHHNGGVELNNVALVQSNVVVGSQPLEKHSRSLKATRKPQRLLSA